MDRVGHRNRSHCRPGAGAGLSTESQVRSHSETGLPNSYTPVGAVSVDHGGQNKNRFPAIAGPPIGLRRNSLREHGRADWVPPLGPASRPVAVPDDLEESTFTKAFGEVVLPFHIRWSGPPLTYDLTDRADPARVYEQVLREGTEEDVRSFVDVNALLDLWDDLVLPATVRRAWAAWFKRHRKIDLGC